jgi:hypothetical protein
VKDVLSTLPSLGNKKTSVCRNGQHWLWLLPKKNEWLGCSDCEKASTFQGHYELIVIRETDFGQTSILDTGEWDCWACGPGVFLRNDSECHLGRPCHPVRYCIRPYWPVGLRLGLCISFNWGEEEDQVLQIITVAAASRASHEREKGTILTSVS